MIRQGTIDDLEDIINMLQEYKKHSPLKDLHDASDKAVRVILKRVLEDGHGIVFVSEDPANELTGMLIAIKSANIWDNSIWCMNELAYWVNPESRNTSAGYRLLTAYVDTCEFMKRGGEIKYYTISKMVTSPDLNYERFGFSKLEETWSR